MSHPYSGSAGYIYANEYLEEDNQPIPRSYYYRQTEWMPVPSPTPRISSPVQVPLRSSGQRFISAPHLPPPTSFKTDHYKTFSASSTVSTVPKSSVTTAYTYESMRVRFDTPNQHIVAWRRQVKAVKRRIQRFRQRVSGLLTPNWITTPHPRLSMIG
ncbi:hypothetical protein GALMADRAFT_232481 [Galerina marginata CBS 339.88]|uniref:Uncharacterized protein n=1 Tax=Galerina marginata (strain CBS 339.88) TaxID=685588 RepID=A0A067SFB4_GALM3|nr:hypothetical protein GALMADRAFT_232481 [Galerina marginata CBS 339.88]